MAKEKNSGIYFKVSDQERQLIEQRMEDAGVSNMSAFIRKMCLNGLIVRLDIPQIPDCSKYLKSASNNLNQIARRLNSGGGGRGQGRQAPGVQNPGGKTVHSLRFALRRLY
ncbi:MAG: plasmid mobilization relaxosome protein MobC [Oscillospiraceae bacterium]|nr:plasmid mobilization relaxosome protein MobC [Oscillospiraceae bacterium]